MSNYKSRRTFSSIKALLTLSVVLFFGCSSPSLKVSMDSSDKLNSDATGASYAVLVRFYQLTDPSLFIKADASSLFRKDDELLGVTLVNKREMMVSPGHSTNLEIPKVSGAEYLAVAAFFRNASNEQLVVKKVNSGFLPFSTNLNLALNDNKISLVYR
ncbi:type VI secretion system lipoprotein TssJ [Reinekea forsetii]|nr:type VI secretion system lipoprotein TssJ [Reinekea forsetii]